MRPFEIRAARASDVPEIVRLIRAKAEFDGCLHTLKASETTVADALFSAPPRAHALVAAQGAELVGLVTYYGIYSSFIAKSGIWLDDLYVYERHRKRGIGKALIVELCSIARTAGCGRIDWIVARDNVDGRAFYQRLGAEVFEQVRHARLGEFAIDRLAPSGAE